VAEEVYRILRDDGIDVRLRTKASRVEANKSGVTSLSVCGLETFIVAARTNPSHTGCHARSAA